MNEFFPEIEITQEQAEAIAKGLFAVARADGNVHPAEAAMIGEFYAASADHPSNLGSLERESAIDSQSLAQQLPSAELQELFIKTALLLAYTDGEYAEGERRLIVEYAEAFGISAESIQKIEHSVKEFLLSQLSHLQNIEASAKVAKDLKI